MPVTDRTISHVTRDRIAAQSAQGAAVSSPPFSQGKLKTASSRLLVGIHAAIRFKDDLNAIETAEATVVASPAVSRKNGYR